MAVSLIPQISSASTASPPKNCSDCRLRKTDAFIAIKPKELALINTFRRDTLAIPANGTVIYEKSNAGKLYTVYAGWAFRYKTLSDGRRQILNFVLPGDFIGLQQEFADNATHGIEAITQTQLCVFPRNGLWEFFKEDPSLGYDVTWLAAREEGMIDDNLVTTGQRNAAERIAVLLMQLYRRMERIGLVENNSIAFPLNQQHIADALGLSLVHTNKTLRRLEKLGMHTLENGRLTLCNTSALERIADYYDRPPKKVPLL